LFSEGFGCGGGSWVPFSGCFSAFTTSFDLSSLLAVLVFFGRLFDFKDHTIVASIPHGMAHRGCLLFLAFFPNVGVPVRLYSWVALISPACVGGGRFCRCGIKITPTNIVSLSDFPGTRQHFCFFPLALPFDGDHPIGAAGCTGGSLLCPRPMSQLVWTGVMVRRFEFLFTVSRVGFFCFDVFGAVPLPVIVFSHALNALGRAGGFPNLVLVSGWGVSYINFCRFLRYYLFAIPLQVVYSLAMTLPQGP